MTNETIDPDRVNTIFMSCLFKDGEDTSNYIRADGITQNVGFHPARLESHRAEVRTMLALLPDEFHATAGGGWSFLNACMTRHGDQWTGVHRTMEQLFQLGVGLNLAKCQLPREMWAALPGGVPYYVVTL